MFNALQPSGAGRADRKGNGGPSRTRELTAYSMTLMNSGLPDSAPESGLQLWLLVRKQPVSFRTTTRKLNHAAARSLQYPSSSFWMLLTA